MRKRHGIQRRSLFTSPVPRASARPKIKWKVLPILWLAFKRMCFVLGAVVFFSALMGVYTASHFTKPAPPSLPGRMVLYAEFEDGFRETNAGGGFGGGIFDDQLSVRQIVNTFDRAAKDKRVKGLLARIGGNGFSLAHAREVRDAVKRFRAGGKFAYVYAPSYGEGGGGLSELYLASVFQERWMQPMGVVAINGIKAEMPFARDVLDKIGVTPQFYKRKEFKTAYENITDKHISPENKKMITDIVNGTRGAIMADVPGDLGIAPEQFGKLVDKGLFTADEALKAKLITNLDYVDVLVGRINKDITGDPETKEPIFIDMRDYAPMLQGESATAMVENAFMKAKPRAALIYASGMIMDSAPDGGGNGIAAADEIAPAIMDATDDDRVGAIVLRIDSPGGSPVASESILRALDKAQAKGKKVIVSMGPTAASGGYWIAAHADRIFALPTTLTGSIGVVGGKFSIGELWKKIGVNWDEGAQWGANAGLWSVNTPFSDSEAERINAMLDQVYTGFIARVAKGRRMTPEQVDKIARGRVWMGAQAKEIGLVDELGGLHEAMNYTAQMLGAKDQDGLDVVILPRPVTPLEALVQLLSERGLIFESLRFQGVLAQALRPYMNEAAVLGAGAAAYEPLRIR